MALDPRLLAAQALEQAPPGTPPGPPPGLPGGPPPQEQTPPTLVPRHLQAELAQALNERKLAIAQQIAAAYGPPEQSVELDDQALLKLWRYRNPALDLDAQRAQGVPEAQLVDQVYPLRRGLIDSVFGWQAKVALAQKLRRLDETTPTAHVGPIAVPTTDLDRLPLTEEE